MDIDQSTAVGTVLDRLLSVLLPLFIKDEISPTSSAAGDTPASSLRARRCFFITIPSVKKQGDPPAGASEAISWSVASNCTLTSPPRSLPAECCNHGGGAVGGAADDGESETILRCGTAAGVVAISQRAEVAAHIVGSIDHGIASFFHRGAVIIHAHAQWSRRYPAGLRCW